MIFKTKETRAGAILFDTHSRSIMWSLSSGEITQLLCTRKCDFLPSFWYFSFLQCYVWGGLVRGSGLDAICNSTFCFDTKIHIWHKLDVHDLRLATHIFLGDQRFSLMWIIFYFLSKKNLIWSQWFFPVKWLFRLFSTICIHFDPYIYFCFFRWEHLLWHDSCSATVINNQM